MALGNFPFPSQSLRPGRGGRPGDSGDCRSPRFAEDLPLRRGVEIPFPPQTPLQPPRPDFPLHLAVPADFMSLCTPKCAPGPGAGGPVLTQSWRGARRESEPRVRAPTLPLTSYNVVRFISLSLDGVTVQNHRLFKSNTSWHLQRRSPRVGRGLRSCPISHLQKDAPGSV